MPLALVLARTAEGRAVIHNRANIGNIIKFIARLIDSGHAYPAPNGDVYFSVSSFKRYGCLSNRSVEDMLDRVRVDLRITS